MVGEYQVTVGGVNHGFTLKQGQFTSFDNPNGVFTIPNAMNDTGFVVGITCLANCGFPHILGFMYDGQTFTPLSYPGEPGTEPNGINNAGEVVGRVDGARYDRAFELANGQFTLFELPMESPDDDALGINNVGEIVGGQYKFLTGGWHAWAYANGGFRLLDLSLTSVANGVSDNGVIVGWWFNGTAQVGFVWSKGKMISLSYPGAFATTARGINNAGQVVGDFTPGVGTEDHGFVTSPITDADFEREGVPAPLLTSN